MTNTYAMCQRSGMCDFLCIHSQLSLFFTKSLNIWTFLIIFIWLTNKIDFSGFLQARVSNDADRLHLMEKYIKDFCDEKQKSQGN